MMKTHDEIKMALRRFGKEVGDAYITSLANGGEQDEALEEYIYTLNGAHEYIQQLEAKIPKWTSVEEKLPEKVGMVLAVIYGSVWVVWYKSGGKFESPSGLEFKDGAVTHWMPLPEPPEEDEK